MKSGELTIVSRSLELPTPGEEVDLVDLTSDINKFIKESQIKEGRITVFVPGSTGSIIATEFEPRLIEDTKNIIQSLIPRGQGYQHDKIDNNAHSHLRASLFGSEMTIPIINSKPTLGTWQQVVFADMDVRPRRRTIVMQILGLK